MYVCAETFITKYIHTYAVNVCTYVRLADTHKPAQFCIFHLILLFHCFNGLTVLLDSLNGQQVQHCIGIRMYTWPLSPATQCFGIQVRTTKQPMTGDEVDKSLHVTGNTTSQARSHGTAVPLTHCTPVRQWLPVSRAA